MRTAGPIRAVVFDFDGTLVDSNGVKRDAYDAAFELVPSATTAIAAALAAHPDRDRRFIIEFVVKTLRRHGKLGGVEANRLAGSALRRYSRFCSDAVGAAPDFPGVTAALRTLSRKYRLAINSGTQQDQLRRLVRARRWGAYCELVLGSPSTKLNNLERISNHFKLEPSQLVLIGDSRIDADAADRFGCAFIHAVHQQESLSGKWPCVMTLSDLPRAVARLGRGEIPSV